MIPEKYTFKQQYAGDTFKGLLMTLKDENNVNPIDITGYQFKMQIKTSELGQIIKELTNDFGITITDAVNGAFKIDEFLTPQKSGSFYYDLQVTYPNNKVDTYMRGYFPITQDITR